MNAIALKGRPDSPVIGRRGTRIPDLFLPGRAMASKPAPGHRFLPFEQLGIGRLFSGGAPDPAGYNSTGDLLTQTADGLDLNDLFNEFQQVLALQNAVRDRFIDLLTFKVEQPVESVLGGSARAEFERSTEYGEPVGMRTRPEYWQMGYDFDWYDLAARFTWRFLAESTASQLQALTAQAVEADNRLVFSKVMQTVFNPTNLSATISGNAYNVYKFWNGVAVGTVKPPDYKNNTFLTTHNHYLASGAATLDSGDLETMQDRLSEHGYTVANGNQLVLMINPAQGDVIRSFRFGVTNNNSAVAKYDFIPSLAQPDFTLSTTQTIVGNRPAGTFRGFSVLGSYGDWLVVVDDYIPAGYLFGFATGGSLAIGNPVGIREHSNPALRGMRLVKGRTPDYPLIDSFYQRAFGTGVRERSAGVVLQITAGSYAVPAIYA